ncbi:MAG: hypothetical protein ABW044_07115 [Cellvibrio sp.]
MSPHVEGEICFGRRDGMPITVEYYKNPEASADKVRDGWLHMGDLGHQDENGWFHLMYIRQSRTPRQDGEMHTHDIHFCISA